MLFAGDAHAPQLEAAIRRLLAQRQQQRLKVDGLKMARHGSARNNSAELLSLLDGSRYLISTNGSRHHHLDPAALARVLDTRAEGVEFYFNYRSEETTPWDDEERRHEYGYITHYPGADKDGYQTIVI